MKKIMFNDRYGLTESVLEGRKTMTRRIVPIQYVPMIEDGLQGAALIEAQRKGYAFNDGEVVSVAQAYKDLGYTKEWVEQHIKPNPNAKPSDPFEKQYPGWTNKMFVPAELNMARKIRITDIKVERMQDISDEDCLSEGIIDCGVGARHYWFVDVQPCQYYFFPREAFARLIDKVSGKGTWERNPYVFAYSFELVNDNITNIKRGEVLEKELVDYHNENLISRADGTLLSVETGEELTWNEYEGIANHFFELGLKAHKGE